jgi:hypothetical protein
MSRLPARFWAQIVVDENVGCWLWTGHRDEGGYGRVTKGFETVYVHRVVWKALRGQLPPVLHHVCPNKACCNPDHCEPRTRQMHGGERERAKTHCPAGHPYSGANLYWNRKGGRQCRICNRESWQRTVERKKTARLARLGATA